ncbi:MAG: 5-bromo-4-chloroindolyl phosphate hydrolysis family protein [Oscillospiraceae bacterium]|nr:5-bromo-4-chloroindolyl phosphate hydrolysis family protein [Oscillospiraceae bacterium]
MDKNKNFNKKARSADIGIGWALIAVSIIIVPGLFFILAVVNGFTTSLSTSLSIIFFGVVFWVFWVVAGIKMFIRAERAKKYVKLFGAAPRFKMLELMRKTGRPLRAVSADMNLFKRRRYWHELSFDLENKDIVFSDSLSSSVPLMPLDNEPMTMYKEKRGFPIYALVACGVTALCFSFHWLPSLIMGVGGFFLAQGLFPAPVYFIETERKSVKAVKTKLKKPGATGNETLDEMLSSVFDNKKELVRVSGAIASPKVKGSLSEMLRVLDQITEYVTQNPDKVRNLRQFVGYYLPTTVSFLQTYEELEQKTDKGENIRTALSKIEETTSKMTGVFKQEYDNLFSDRVMDISAEAAVMQTIINESKF